jgi:biopolymer transport protein ExbD
MAKRDIEEINAGSMADIAFLLVIFFLITTTMIKPQISEERLSQKSDVEFLLKQENVLSILANKEDSIYIQGGGLTYLDLAVELEEIKKAVMYFYEHDYNKPSKNALKKDRYIAKNNEIITNPYDPSKELPFPSYIWVSETNCNDTIKELELRLKEIESQNENHPDFEYKEKYVLELATWNKNLDAVKIIGDFKVLPVNATVTILTDNETTYDTYMQVLDHIMQGLNELRNKLSKDKFGKSYDKLNDDPDDESNEIDKIKAIQQVYPKRIMKQKQVSY